ncbi:putative copper amine oxidase [Pyrenochaeta sp. MPI-SDFR-AT-0127]|nr:putative copper amine oxidase [Pyrenochaeta sp. MPI-SDFR-AT-0127]
MLTKAFVHFTALLLGVVESSTPYRNHNKLLEIRNNGTCPAKQPIIDAPHKNIWISLTDQEASSVIQLLQNNNTGFNLTGPNERGNSITLIELLPPNKTSALPYISGKGPEPLRYARARLTIRSVAEPYVQDFMVGPLPVSNQTTIQPLDFLYNKGQGKIRMYDAESEQTNAWDKAIGESVAGVTKALWNATLNDTLTLQAINPYWLDDDRVIVWKGFSNTPTSDFDTGTLLPLGLYVGSDVTGRDSTKWKVTGWLYNNKFYSTTQKFVDAANSPGFEKLGANVDGPWAQTDKRGDALPYDSQPPPALVQSGNRRFSVNVKDNFVSWMDFSFFLATTRDTGLRLYDVKYKGQRILYELGLEEAVTHYAGNDPVQSGTTYFDSLPGFGPNIGYPIQRHTTSGYTSVTKNIAFTIRSISTIGNYDFITSYNFYLDGTMEVSVRASGYIQSAFFAANEDYGFKIHDNLSGSLHDHVLTFKADFDILGEKNSVQKVEFVPTTEEYIWNKGKKRNTMKVRRSFVSNEDESKINWAPNGAAMYSIVNKDEKNKYGEYRGYRFTPATGNTIHLTVQNSSNIGKAANFATHHFYVTKQKDTEAQAAHSYNQLDTANPLIDFDKFFDHESLDQEDLVVWFNLGMHHIPHTGDLPNTVFTTAHSAMIIEPQNYLEGDPSRATTQQIRVSYGDSTTVKTFGADPATCPVDMVGSIVS